MNRRELLFAAGGAAAVSALGVLTPNAAYAAGGHKHEHPSNVGN